MALTTTSPGHPGDSSVATKNASPATPSQAARVPVRRVAPITCALAGSHASLLANQPRHPQFGGRRRQSQAANRRACPLRFSNGYWRAWGWLPGLDCPRRGVWAIALLSLDCMPPRRPAEANCGPIRRCGDRGRKEGQLRAASGRRLPHRRPAEANCGPIRRCGDRTERGPAPRRERRRGDTWRGPRRPHATQRAGQGDPLASPFGSATSQAQADL
jgi:hypothetical protein